MVGDQGRDELIAGKPDASLSRRWVALALVATIVAVAATVSWIHRAQADAAADRLDAATLRQLPHLAAVGHASGESPAGLGVQVAYDDDDGGEPHLPPIRVLHMDLAAGALGDVHAVVIDQFEGVGPGPVLQDIKPFTADVYGIQMDLTFTHPAVCHRPLSADPPLLLTLRLPSGRTVTRALRIDHVFNPYGRGWSTASPHRPWPQVLSAVACHLA